MVFLEQFSPTFYKQTRALGKRLNVNAYFRILIKVPYGANLFTKLFLRLPSLSFFLAGKEQDYAEDLNHLM